MAAVVGVGRSVDRSEVEKDLLGSRDEIGLDWERSAWQAPVMRKQRAASTHDHPKTDCLEALCQH